MASLEKLSPRNPVRNQATHRFEAYAVSKHMGLNCTLPSPLFLPRQHPIGRGFLRRRAWRPSGVGAAVADVLELVGQQLSEHRLKGDQVPSDKL